MTTSNAANHKELMLNELELGVLGTIVVMICWMWNVNSAVGSYLSTDFIVFDKKGNLLHCTARGNIAHNFLRLKEGSVYSVRNFTVQPDKDDFRLLRSAHFMLELDGDTVVKKSSCSLEDVVGYVTKVGRIATQKSGSNILDFYLGNNRGQSIRVTFGGALGDVLIEKRTCHVGLYPVVLTAMSVKLYNNRLYLSSKSSTVIVDDEWVPVLKRLKTDDSEVELTKELLPPDSSEAKPGTLENLLMWARNRKYGSSTFHCTITIDKIKTKKGWNYPSCSGDKCKKGNLDRKYGKFWCESCESVVDYPVIRYRLEVEIYDATAETVVVIFDEQDEGEVVTVHTLELKSHTYFEHSNYESFTSWKVVEYEHADETDNSAIVAPSPVPKSPRLKSLVVAPSVPTPSKPGKPKQSQRHELEESDVDESSVAGTDAKKGDASCLAGTKKRKRMVLDECESTQYVWGIKRMTMKCWHQYCSQCLWY